MGRSPLSSPVHILPTRDPQRLSSLLPMHPSILQLMGPPQSERVHICVAALVTLPALTLVRDLAFQPLLHSAFFPSHS